MDEITDLLSVLQYGNAAERYQALRMLVDLNDKRAVAPVIALLQSDIAGSIKTTLVDVLKDLPDERAAEPLIRAVGDPKPPATTSIRAALIAIGKNAVPSLVRALGDPHPDIRSMAADTLVDLGDETVLPALEAAKNTETGVTSWGQPVKKDISRAIRTIKGRNQSRIEDPFVFQHLRRGSDKWRWKNILHQWSRTLIWSGILQAEPEENQIVATWLGRKGATETQIIEVEKRLGLSLPPSYRAFLKISNGWGQLTPSIYNLWSTKDVDWFRVKHPALLEIWMKDADIALFDDAELEDSERNQVLSLGQQYFYEALEISDEGDETILLLNPLVINADGEWEAWKVSSLTPGVSRYPSFFDLMHAEYSYLVKYVGRGSGSTAQPEE